MIGAEGIDFKVIEDTLKTKYPDKTMLEIRSALIPLLAADLVEWNGNLIKRTNGN